MADEPGRPAGLLTDTQRDYLAGNWDGGESAEYKLRQRRPDRIRHSILDFALLADGLPDHAREEIFSPAEYPLEGSDGHLYREDEHFTEFVRNYPDDAGIPFDSFLETAIRRVFDERYEVHVETSRKLLPPELDSKPDVNDIERKVQSDTNTEPLSDTELRILLTESGWDPETVAEAYECQQNEESETVEMTDIVADDADAIRARRIRKRQPAATLAAEAYENAGGNPTDSLQKWKAWVEERRDELEDPDSIEYRRVRHALEYFEAYVDADGDPSDSLEDLREWRDRDTDGEDGPDAGAE